MEPRQDWPLGPELKRHRIAKGLSVRAAAALTNKTVSETRWRQLESGVQSIPGGTAPINTTVRTVVAAAKAVDWNPRDAAKLAGFNPDDAGPSVVTLHVEGIEQAPDLEQLSDDDLLAELCRRLKQRHQPQHPVPLSITRSPYAPPEDTGVGGNEEPDHRRQFGST